MSEKFSSAEKGIVFLFEFTILRIFLNVFDAIDFVMWWKMSWDRIRINQNKFSVNPHKIDNRNNVDMCVTNKCQMVLSKRIKNSFFFRWKKSFSFVQMCSNVLYQCCCSFSYWIEFYNVIPLTSAMIITFVNAFAFLSVQINHAKWHCISIDRFIHKSFRERK